MRSELVGRRVRWAPSDSPFLHNYLIPSFGDGEMVVENFEASSLGWESVILSRDGELLREAWFPPRETPSPDWVGQLCRFNLGWFELI